MRKTSLGLAASMAAMAISAGTAPAPGHDYARTTSAQNPADVPPSKPVARKKQRVNNGGYRRINRNYCGKRYSASVRQHQRHALKAKNRKRSRT